MIVILIEHGARRSLAVKAGVHVIASAHAQDALPSLYASYCAQRAARPSLHARACLRGVQAEPDLRHKLRDSAGQSGMSPSCSPTPPAAQCRFLASDPFVGVITGT